MYFALLWKTPHLSIAEMELVRPREVHQVGSVVFFDLDDKIHAEKGEHPLDRLAGIMKRWKVLEPRAGASDEVSPLGKYDEALEHILHGVTLLGTNDKTLGMRAKKLYGVKRFKQVELEKADRDVKHSGVEILHLGNGQYGQVHGWQPIDRFAAIDFDKPERGMQIGMMPAKLTQMLVNIGARYAHTSSVPLNTWLPTSLNTSPPTPLNTSPPTPLLEGEGSRLGWSDARLLTVYDPFCGFGTTLCVANSLGYHAIGSDINSTLAKKNVKRRPTTQRAHTDRYLTLYKHDVHDPFSKQFLHAVNVIVTEGWLGPVVKSVNVANKGQQAVVLKNIEQIVEVYRAFLSNVKDFFVDVPVVMTVPVYDWLGDVIEQRITVYAEHMWLTVTPVGEIYKRKKQTVGRRVLVVR